MSDTPGALYLEHQAVIESAIRFVCRRMHLRGDHAQEFAAEVRLRFVESDKILRQHDGRAKLQTYLTVVIHRMALDYQAAHWGRWRPSATARAEGAHGVRLEQLVVRDGVPLADALTALEREMGPIDRPRLETLAARFPVRVRRQYVGQELLEACVASSPDASRLLVQSEEEERFGRVTRRLHALTEALDPSTQLVVKLRFEQGMKVADIARLLGADQKKLYRQLTDVLGGLRRALESEGVDVAGVRAMLDGLAPEDSARKPAQPVRLYERNTP